MLLAAAKLDILVYIFAIAFGLVLFLISLSFAAFVLKMACRTVGAEVPDTGKAMVISFLESLCCFVAYLLALSCVWLLANAAGNQTPLLAVVTGLSFITIAFVVPAGIYVPMLRVSFPKGLALVALRYVITLSIYLMVGVAIGMATGRLKI